MQCVGGLTLGGSAQWRVNIGRVKARLQPNNPLSIHGYTLMTQLPKTPKEFNPGSHCWFGNYVRPYKQSSWTASWSQLNEWPDTLEGFLPLPQVGTLGAS